MQKRQVLFVSCVLALCLSGQAYGAINYTMAQLGPDMTTNVHAIALDGAGTGLLVGEGGNSASIVLNRLDIATGVLTPYLDLWTSPDFAEVVIRDIDVDPVSGDIAVLLWRNEGALSAKWLQIYDSSLTLENTWDVSGRNGCAWGLDGKVYIAGEGGANLYEVDPDTGAEISHTVPGNQLGIARDSNGKLLLGDYAKIHRFDPVTDTVSMWINGRDVGVEPEKWYAPNLMGAGAEIEDIAIGNGGRVIVNSRNDSMLHIFEPDGLGPVIQVEDLSGEFANNNERKMVADAAGNIYLIHNGNNAATGNNAGVYKFTVTVADDDGDGVPNGQDDCLSNPPGAEVDPCGCELPDTDGDGVYDYADLCPGTDPCLPVNANGCPDTDGDGVYDDELVFQPVAAPTAQELTSLVHKM